MAQEQPVFVIGGPQRAGGAWVGKSARGVRRSRVQRRGKLRDSRRAYSTGKLTGGREERGSWGECLKYKKINEYLAERRGFKGKRRVEGRKLGVSFER